MRTKRDTFRNLMELADKFNFSDSFYFALEDLVNWDCLRFLPLNLNLATVLKHIALRAYPFRKVIERVSLVDIMNGFPQLLIPPLSCSRSTTWRCLGRLVEDRFLIKLTFQPGDDPVCLYGLNLPFVISSVHTSFVKSLRSRGVSKTRIEKAHKVELCLSTCVAYLRDFNAAFDSMTYYGEIRDFTTFVDEVVFCLPSTKKKIRLNEEFQEQREKDRRSVKRRKSDKLNKGQIVNVDFTGKVN